MASGILPASLNLLNVFDTQHRAKYSRTEFVDYGASNYYNNSIDFLTKLYFKIQSSLCPLLILVYANFQKTLKITCRNEPGKWLKQPVSEG